MTPAGAHSKMNALIYIPVGTATSSAPWASHCGPSGGQKENWFPSSGCFPCLALGQSPDKPVPSTSQVPPTESADTSKGEISLTVAPIPGPISPQMGT